MMAEVGFVDSKGLWHPFRVHPVIQLEPEVSSLRSSTSGYFLASLRDGGGLTGGGERRRVWESDNHPLRLRRETTMTVAWIAGRLEMGSRDAVNNLLNRK